MAVALLLCCGLIAQAAPPLAASSAAYIPQRVYDTRGRAFTDFESMVADLARADVVFVGEQHDDPNTHRLEGALLEGLLRRRVQVTLSLEMFERDTQPALDRFLAGESTEDEFLKNARPWPRYATDYRPLIVLARTHSWPVIASNVPRRHASAIAKGGIGAVEQFSDAERPQAAREFQCPHDSYFEKFAASMAEHPPPDADKLTDDQKRSRTGRYYESQCAKDETMAESIAAVVGRRPGPVVHINGAFHSDFGLGAAERTRRRLPGRRVVVVSILPVSDLDALKPEGDDLERADYLLYTTK